MSHEHKCRAVTLCSYMAGTSKVFMSRNREEKNHYRSRSRSAGWERNVLTFLSSVSSTGLNFFPIETVICLIQNWDKLTPPEKKWPYREDVHALIRLLSVPLSSLLSPKDQSEPLH